MFYKDTLNKAKKQFEKKKKEYEALGKKAESYTLKLYQNRKVAAKTINRFQTFLTKISNLPNSLLLKSNRNNGIDGFFNAVEFEGNNTNNHNVGKAMVAGVATGSAVATMGAPAAMAVATTFGTASTGTAISTLSGAAATNAAIAWLGGGTLAAGGGGISAGSAFLALAGPVGWSVAAVAVAGGGFLAYFKNKKSSEEIKKQCIAIDNNIKLLTPKLERLISINEEIEEWNLKTNILKIVNSYPRDYQSFSIEQKTEFNEFLEKINKIVMLINERIY